MIEVVMANVELIHSEKIQDNLDRLSDERIERICKIAIESKTDSELELYRSIISDELITSIDIEIVRLLNNL